MPSEIASGAEQIDNAAHEIARPLVEAVTDYLAWTEGDGGGSVDGGELLTRMREEARKLKGD